MRAVGLITEYNPFHNGHLHHLRQSLRLADAEVAVAVMSGHFLQRGEPALLDKWTRAQMALGAGVDLVVELPLPWACNSAPHFALGAVQSLTALGVDALCFGSESGALGELQDCARLLRKHERDLEARTAALLRRGLSYPAARQQLLSELSGEPETAARLATPNNILGIEYLRALEKTSSPIQPLTLARLGAGYHDREAVGDIASATGIRKMLCEGSEVAALMPEASFGPMADALSGGMTADLPMYFRLLQARILRGADSLSGLYLVEQGMERRLFEAALEGADLEELIAGVKVRQLTRTRVQRLLCMVFNEVEQGSMAGFLDTGPLFLHLLAAGPRGRAFLADRRKELALPVVGNYSRIHAVLKRRYGSGSPLWTQAVAQLEVELRASRNYSLLMPQWGGNRNRDYFEEVRSL